LQLVATMLSNGISRIYTYNNADFAQYQEVEAITPAAVLTFPFLPIPHPIFFVIGNSFAHIPRTTRFH
jgi:hypothetical protein